jgi:hypothetical protein
VPISKSKQLNNHHQAEQRNQPRQPATAPTTPSDDDRPVWGAAAIGAVIGVSERSAFHLLESKALRGAKRIGGKWTARPSVLLRAWESEA